MRRTSVGQQQRAELNGLPGGVLVGDMGAMQRAIELRDASIYVGCVRGRFERLFCAIVDGCVVPQGKNFLTDNVLVGGVNQPLDRSKESFKGALIDCLRGFKISNPGVPKDTSNFIELCFFHEQCSTPLYGAVQKWLAGLMSPQSLVSGDTIYSKVPLLNTEGFNPDPSRITPGFCLGLEDSNARNVGIKTGSVWQFMNCFHHAIRSSVM